MTCVAPGAHAAVTLAQSDPMIGRWINPRNSLAVETRPCAGGTLCGRIVWVSPRARAAARLAGLPDLVGTPMLQGYRRVGPDGWLGRVFVPDMGRSFSSRLRQTSPTTLVISGCVLRGYLCRSQVWRRVA